MAEYIDRELLLVAIEDRIGNLPELTELIKMLPTEDVVPVMHAKWTDPEDDNQGIEWHCSNCGLTVSSIFGNPSWNYCSRCGAKFDLN